jgi:DNA-binding NarL/FixJ family response regulator
MSEPTPPVRFTRTTDGVSIAYMVWPGEGVPWLRVRPLGAMPMALSATIERVRRFAHDRPMVWFDWRGTGQSARQPPASMDDVLLDVDAVMSVIECDVVDVVANGAACFPACTYAASRGKRWRSLLLVDPMLRIEGSTFGIHTRPGYDDDMEVYFAAQVPTFLPGMSKEETERIARSWAETVPREANLAFRSIDRKIDLTGAFASLDMPALIVKSAPRSAADTVAALLTNGILLERSSAHPGRGLREAWDEHIGSQFADQPHTSAAAPVLTQREQEILGLLAGGCSNDEIGRRLSLSTRTVERHVQNIYAKLNVHNRAEATRWAIEHGVG